MLTTLLAPPSLLLAPPSLLLRGAAARRSAHPVLSAAKLGSLLNVCEKYDCLLLDQFGVIHDGTTAYDGAVSAVSELQRRGKKIVIISNSSRRRGDTVARLRQMGFAISDDDVVTSGDLVFEGLRAGVDAPRPPFDGLGMRCFVFGNGADDEQYVRDAGRVAAPVESADFILARGLFSMLGAGPDLLRQPTADYTAEAEAEVLAAAMARAPGGLPLLVANPDLTRPDGKDSPMPGRLAQRYRELGAADIRLVGKPHALIYEACRARLAASGIEGGRIAAVGDSLHHDVLGASDNGVDSVFICGGVHCAELGVAQAQAETPEQAKLNALLDGFAAEHGGVRPTHTLAGFCE